MCLEMDNGGNALFNKIVGNSGQYNGIIKNVKVMSGINDSVNGMTPILIPVEMMKSDTSTTIVTRTWSKSKGGIVKIYNDGSMIP